MSNILTSINLITEGTDGFVDFSNATVVQSNKSTGTGCLTFIHAGGAIRLKLYEALYKALGSPEAVVIKIVDKKLGLFPADVDSMGANKISKDRLIYNNGLVRAIIELTGVKIRDEGSTKAGSYVMQQNSDGSTFAVVSFA